MLFIITNLLVAGVMKWVNMKYIHTCMHACMHTYIHTYINSYMHTYRYVCCCKFRCSGTGKRFRIERRHVFFLIRTRGRRHQVFSSLKACWQTELSRIKLKNWTRQPAPMINEHSAHSIPLPVGFRSWLWRYTRLLLLISMLWHRQATFELKWDKSFSSLECKILTQGLRHQVTSKLNDHWETDWAIEDQAKNLNSTAHPYYQRAYHRT